MNVTRERWLLLSLSMLSAPLFCAEGAQVAQEAPDPVVIEQEEAPVEQKPAYRIATYNVRRKGKEKTDERKWKHRLSLVVALMQQIGADVFGLQEPTKRQVKDLAKQFPQFAHVGEGRGSSWWGLGTNEYTPVFYNTDKFELLEYDTFSINKLEGRWMPWHAKQTGWLPRICTWVKLRAKVTGQEVYVYNTHLDHDFGQAQVTCVKSIVDHINKHATDAPVIVTGDFNAPFDGDLKELFADFVHAKDLAQEIVGPHETSTGWDSKELKWIDHILVNNQEAMQILKHEVIERDDYPSDHRPVFADIVLPQ